MTEPIATLVVPAYNAASFVTRTAGELRRFVTRHPDWRVLFVCDGCTDATPARLGEACAAVPELDMKVFNENRGKGHAIRSGFDAASTPYLAFTDVDLAYDPEDACRMIGVLREGADVVVANRASPASRYWISPRDFSVDLPPPPHEPGLQRLGSRDAAHRGPGHPGWPEGADPGRLATAGPVAHGGRLRAERKPTGDAGPCGEGEPERRRPTARSPAGTRRPAQNRPCGPASPVVGS